MAWVYALIWGSWVLFGALTVFGLAWAVRTGQLARPRAGAESIFDADEPVGQVTDRFPDGGARRDRGGEGEWRR